MNDPKNRQLSFEDETIRHSEGEDEENRGFSPEYYSNLTGRSSGEDISDLDDVNPTNEDLEEDYENRKISER